MTTALLALFLAAQPAWIFYAFDNGAGRGKLPFDRQYEIVRAAGYPGIGYEGVEDLPAAFEALDAAGLKMFSTYLVVDLSAPDVEQWREGIARLRGRGTLLLVALNGQPEDVATRGVEAIRSVAEMARESNLKVAIYPHYRFAVARFHEALALVNELAIPNVGVSFNLCHWLRERDTAAIEERIQQAGARLIAVSINGAEAGGEDWSRLIQPLGAGSYDLTPLIRALESIGYSGPVGLQGYAVPGDPLTNLRSSFTAWRALTAGR
jgi:sugar phosphate isomerase/epimerase